MSDPGTQQTIRGYLMRARQMLRTSRWTLEHQDYITAVNRAYYAIFYAANALLATKRMERNKHSGVTAAFREHFVKTGLLESEYSDWYGTTMDTRQRGDYTFELALDEMRASELPASRTVCQSCGTLPARRRVFKMIGSLVFLQDNVGDRSNMMACPCCQN